VRIIFQKQRVVVLMIGIEERGGTVWTKCTEKSIRDKKEGNARPKEASRKKKNSFGKWEGRSLGSALHEGKTGGKGDPSLEKHITVH